MTEAQDTTGRRVKWMRYTAWAFGLLWAVWWSLVVAWFSAGFLGVLHCFDCHPHQQVPVWGTASLATAACLALPIWASAAIAWRWQRVAGVVLVLEGLLLSIPALSMAPLRSVLLSIALRAMPLPPLVAGILFLASWWKSRASEGPEDTNIDPEL